MTAGLLSLPDEVLYEILDRLSSAQQLARMAVLQTRMAPVVHEVARRRVARHVAGTLPLVTSRRGRLSTTAAPHAWLRGLAALETLEHSVGARPTCRWDAEFSPQGDPDDSEDETAAEGDPRHKANPLSAPGAIERYSSKFAWAIELRELAWPREHALAFTLLCTWGNALISRGVRERSPAYAASTWVVCNALAEQAARQRFTRPPPVYANLAGRGGLLADDPAWEALLRVGGEGSAAGGSAAAGSATAGSAAGGSAAGGSPLLLSTSAIVLAASELAWRGVVWAGRPTASQEGAGVVCFRQQSPAFGAHRALVDVGSGRYALPPLARVRLEAVDEPGMWELPGEGGPRAAAGGASCSAQAAARCRRFTVSVNW